ncbi:hypothetical protein J6590_098644 [Homalodisca vitripennis]|nr:hypothetical protein J6590_098644 [Homalodisca vitripennis]
MLTKTHAWRQTIHAWGTAVFDLSRVTNCDFMFVKNTSGYRRQSEKPSERYVLPPGAEVST